MISLTEPVNFLDFYFMDRANCERFEKNTMTDFSNGSLAAYVFVRNTAAFLPSTSSAESLFIWAKLDEFLQRDEEYIKHQFTTFKPEAMYYTATKLLNTGIDILTKFGEMLFEALQKHNTNLYEILLAAIKDIRNHGTWDYTVKQIVVPFIAMGYYVYEQWEQYSKECLTYISMAISVKRNNLELEDLARSADIGLITEYDEYKQRIETIQQREQKFSFFDTRLGSILQSDFFQFFSSDAVLNDISLLHSFNNSVQKTLRKTQRFPYHDKEYSFGHFDETGTFTYTGQMNALALILYDIPMKGWSSCGDKVHRFLEYIHVEGKPTTLIKYLEKVSAAKHDFTKKDFHGEAVELFHAIVKNSE